MICLQSGVLMKKPNNILNWKGSINKIPTHKLKSDYSIRDKLDCPKSKNNLRQEDFILTNDELKFALSIAKHTVLATKVKQQDLEITVTEQQGKGGKGEPIRYKIEKTADN
jgi:hypothetical protein